jgi:hypothetical protein
MQEKLIVDVNRIEKSFDVCTFERNDVVQLAGWNFALPRNTNYDAHFAFLVGFGIA